jgi:hypothetical protein
VFSSRTVSIVILLVSSLTWDNAKAQDPSGQRSVYPLNKFQRGQWVRRCRAISQSQESRSCFEFIRMRDISLFPTLIR